MGISSIATKVAEEIMHKDIDGDGKVGSSAAKTVVDMAEAQSGIDLNGDGKIGGHGAKPKPQV